MATIAELFVNLGIKGDGSANKALKGVKSGLGDVKSMSLEAKAAIVGAVYALERLMSASAQQGTGLMNFNAMTGLSVQKLQEWQYAARQVGVTNDELTGSVKGVQSAMTNMLLGKGAPEGMAMLANKVGFDQSRARDTFYVMEQLQKFAKVVPPDVAGNLMKSFGLSEGVIAGMQRNAFRPDIFAKAPKYSGGEIKQLDKVNAAMANVQQKIEMAFGHFTSKHGMEMVKDISLITDAVARLADAFVHLAEQLKLFQALAEAIKGLAMLADVATGNTKNIKGPREAPKLDKWSDVGLNTDVQSVINKLLGWDKDKNQREPEVRNPQKGDLGAMPETIAPKMPVVHQNTTKQQTINVNQNLKFEHDGKDHKKTGDSVKKAVHDSYRQIQAQSQGA